MLTQHTTPRPRGSFLRPCEACGKEMRVPFSEATTRHFCNRACAAEGARLRATVALVCEQCGKGFTLRACEVKKAGRARYCSPECSVESKRNQVAHICGNCGREFSATPAQARIYCSHECYRAKQYPVRPVRRCQICQREFRPRRDQMGPRQGRFCSKECRAKGLTGPLNPRFIADGKRRASVATRTWTQAVFARDNYHCRHCGKASDGDLNAHHIKSWSEYPDLRFDLDNGITLCWYCHQIAHGNTPKVARPKKRKDAKH